MVKVHADADVCIGAGVCVMTSEAVFDQDDDGIVMVLTEEVPTEEEDRVRDAVKMCPSGALKLG